MNITQTKRFQQLLARRGTHYAFAAVFVLMLAGILVWVVQPNIATIFLLRREKSDLEQINNSYDTVISRIVGYQTLLEKHRAKLHLLDAALPHKLHIAELVTGIQTVASAEGIAIGRMEIASLDLKIASPIAKTIQKNPIIERTVNLSIDATIPFVDIPRMLDVIARQRRMIDMQRVSAQVVNAEKNSSDSARIQLQIFGISL